MRTGITKLSISAFALILLTDFLFAFLSDQRIRRSHYYFNQHLSEVELGSGYGKRSFYRFGTEFYFYTFKTCFFRRTARGYDEWVYTFHYAKPYPILLGGMNRDSYRFKECGSGSSLMRVTSDGRMEE